MARVILTDGSEEFLSPGAAKAKVAAGEATFPKAVPTYSTRQLVAEAPVKTKRKRRTKAEMEADEQKSDESESV
jgi:hypothetical protein